MIKKQAIVAAIVALFLGLATVPASAGRFSTAFKAAAKQWQNAADLHNIGSGTQQDPSPSDIGLKIRDIIRKSDGRGGFCGADEETIESSLCSSIRKRPNQAIIIPERVRELMYSQSILSLDISSLRQEPNINNSR